jgi:CHAT domain-containing protein
MMRVRQFQGIIALLAIMLGWPAATRAQSTDKDRLARAFEYAQLASLTGSTISLEAAAALASRSGKEVAQLEQQRQTDLARLAAVDRRLEQALLGATTDSDRTRSPLLAEREATLARISAAEQSIRQADPAFWDLLQPDAVPLDEVKALLEPDEVLLLLLTRDDATYAFVISRDAAQWHRSTDNAAPQLARLVSSVRSSIREAARDPDLPGAARHARALHGLYQALVAPFDTVLRGKRRLLTVTSGPLDALPLTLFPVSLDEGGAPTEWLIDRYVLGSLATVGMLRTQRCLLASAKARHPGCRIAGGRRSAVPKPAATAFLGVGDPMLGPPAARQEGRSGGADDWLRDGVAVRQQLLSMSSLPGTGTELKAAAQAFGQGRSLLLLGTDATEAVVRNVLAQNHFRFISFATHGVLASQAGVLAEPGLVLTPPALNTTLAAEDGYLTASEIAQLDVSEALMILSACNTATVESGAAGRNLNSIARAFQFAGARQLVVSHWAVNDQATAELMTLFLGRLAAAPDQPPQDALREAQRMLRSQPRYAEPAFWAGFSVVGVK